MINLIICSQCRLILCNDFHTQILQENNDLLGLSILPSHILISKEQSPAFSQENYDYYCFYFDLACSQCSAKIGKNYITFNNYLIKNTIFNILELSKVSFLCFDPIFETGTVVLTTPNTMTKSTADTEQKEIFPHAKSKDPFEEIEVLAEFLNSMRVIQKVRMREVNVRISSLEEKLRCILGLGVD